MSKERQEIKLPAVESTTSFGKVTLRMRPNLFRNMFEIAKEHRDNAVKIGGKNHKAELKESMISIVFSCMCLEAYINKIGGDTLGTGWLKTKASLESKWRRILRELATNKAGVKTSPFNGKKEPYKSFKELIDTRNNIIVHHKAEVMDIVKTKYGNMDGLINMLTAI